MKQGSTNRNSDDSPPFGVMHSHREDTRFDKIRHSRSSWLFWHATSKVFLYVIPRYTVKPWMKIIASHFCSTAYVVKLGENVKNWFQMPSSCMIMLQATQGTSLGVWTLRHPALVHVTTVWFPNWRHSPRGKRFAGGGDGLQVVNSLCQSFVLCCLFLAPQKAQKPWFETRVVCLPPTSSSYARTPIWR
jgi:hypothetical protein